MRIFACFFYPYPSLAIVNDFPDVPAAGAGTNYINIK